MADYDAKIAGIEPPGEGIKAAVCRGFTYTNHDFAFYENIRERC
jgi:GDPmannose 4,6-dehydratase